MQVRFLHAVRIGLFSCLSEGEDEQPYLAQPGEVYSVEAEYHDGLCLMRFMELYAYGEVPPHAFQVEPGFTVRSEILSDN